MSKLNFTKEQLEKLDLSVGGVYKDGELYTTYIHAYGAHGFAINIMPKEEFIVVCKIRNCYGDCRPYEWMSDNNRVEDLIKKRQLNTDEVAELVTLFRKSRVS